MMKILKIRKIPDSQDEEDFWILKMKKISDFQDQDRK